MVKVYDLTAKLSCDTRPIVKIGENEYTLRADAETVLLIFDYLETNENKTDLKTVLKMLSLLFGDDICDYMQKNMTVSDLTFIAQAAIKIASNQNPFENEVTEEKKMSNITA